MLNQLLKFLTLKAAKAIIKKAAFEMLEAWLRSLIDRFEEKLFNVDVDEKRLAEIIVKSAKGETLTNEEANFVDDTIVKIYKNRRYLRFAKSKTVES